MDLASLPLRMTTSEVCALARISKNTFARRRQKGQPLERLTPCDRGAELLFNKSDVLEALGMSGDRTPVPEPRPQWPTDVEQIRKSLAMPTRAEWIAGGAARKKIPVYGPKSQAEIRAHTGFLGKYVVVRARPNGLYHAYFTAPTNIRPKGWKSSIALPAGRGGFKLDDREHIEAIKAEAIALYASMHRERTAQRQ